jgi:hypothetical protein
MCTLADFQWCKESCPVGAASSQMEWAEVIMELVSEL